MKAQNSYSPETLSKLYEKLLKTASKNMSEPSKDGSEVHTKSSKKKFKLGGKTKDAPGISKEEAKKVLKEKGKDMSPKQKAFFEKEAKMKKGGCVGPKYMCGGKKKTIKK